MFEDILGSEEKFYDDTIEFEYYGDSAAEEKRPKVLDLNDFIDEKELEEAIDKVIEEALRNIDDVDETEETGRPGPHDGPI